MFLKIFRHKVNSSLIFSLPVLQAILGEKYFIEAFAVGDIDELIIFKDSFDEIFIYFMLKSSLKPTFCCFQRTLFITVFYLPVYRIPVYGIRYTAARCPGRGLSHISRIVIAMETCNG